MQTYTITSMSRKVNLQERVADVGQPVGGLSVYAAPDGHGTPAVIASQQWMFWKASMGGKASAIGWVLQAVGGSGGLLDYSGECQPVSRACSAAYIASNLRGGVSLHSSTARGCARFLANVAA
jgi:hypothetical protein